MFHHSWSISHHSWSMIHHSWSMIHHAWSMIHHSWSMIHHSWFMIEHLWFMIHHSRWTRGVSFILGGRELRNLLPESSVIKNGCFSSRNRSPFDLRTPRVVYIAWFVDGEARRDDHFGPMLQQFRAHATFRRMKTHVPGNVQIGIRSECFLGLGQNSSKVA